MKLKTMLLPTGEFLLIGENVKWNNSLPETLQNLKEAAGAAGFFVTDDAVQVEDALYDENAVRRQPDDVAAIDDYETVDETNYFSRTHLPNVQMDLPSFEVDGDGVATLTGKAVSTGWLDMSDPETFKTIFGVDITKEYSPAGLVKGNTDTVMVDGFIPGGEPGADPEVEHGQTVLAQPPADFGKALDESARELYDLVTGVDGVTTVTPKEYVPQPGDTVRIVGPSCWGEEGKVNLKDTIGKIVPAVNDDIGLLVEFDFPGRTNVHRWFFQPSSLEVLRG